MVRRDPETGQFVAEDESDGMMSWSETMRISGYVSANIPAANLSGGTGSRDIRDSTLLVDFSQHLANDEVFIVDALRVNASISAPTTATAESSVGASWSIASEARGQLEAYKHVFYNGKDGTENGVDVSNNSKTTNHCLTRGFLIGEASHSDTTNTLGGGSDYENESYLLNFEDTGAKPVYDADDELYAPMRIYSDNVSDHSVGADVSVLVYGHIEELN